MYYEKIANFSNIEIKYVGNSRKFHFIYENSRQSNIKSPLARGLFEFINEPTTFFNCSLYYELFCRTNNILVKHHKISIKYGKKLKNMVK